MPSNVLPSFPSILLISALAFSLPALAGEAVEKYYRKIPMRGRLDQAQIVVIGESHTVPLDRQMEIALIRRMASPGDFLLIEGTGAVPSLKPSADLGELSEFEGSLFIGGWDDQIALRGVIANYHSALQFYDTIQCPQAPISDKAMAFFAALGHQLGRTILHEMRESMMNDKIKLLFEKFPDKRIFVIAGREHVKGNSQLGLTLIGTKRPYAQLIPREGNPSRIHSEDPMSYVRNLRK